MKDMLEPDDMDQGQNPPEDDEIIELTDVVQDTAGVDEPIIDLTDIVETAPPETASPEPPVAVEDEAENVIELTDVVQEHAEATEQMFESALDETAPPENGIVEEIYEEIPDDDDFTDALGVDLEAGIAPLEAPSVSHEQVEAAIERVVKEMLSDKIETLLIKIIDKEVSKEVQRLKNLLLDDATGSDDL